MNGANRYGKVTSVLLIVLLVTGLSVSAAASHTLTYEEADGHNHAVVGPNGELVAMTDEFQSLIIGDMTDNTIDDSFSETVNNVQDVSGPGMAWIDEEHLAYAQTVPRALNVVTGNEALGPDDYPEGPDMSGSIVTAVAANEEMTVFYRQSSDEEYDDVLYFFDTASLDPENWEFIDYVELSGSTSDGEDLTVHPTQNYAATIESGDTVTVFEYDGQGINQVDQIMADDVNAVAYAEDHLYHTNLDEVRRAEVDGSSSSVFIQEFGGIPDYSGGAITLDVSANGQYIYGLADGVTHGMIVYEGDTYHDDWAYEGEGEAPVVVTADGTDYLGYGTHATGATAYVYTAELTAEELGPSPELLGHSVAGSEDDAGMSIIQLVLIAFAVVVVMMLFGRMGRRRGRDQ